MEPAPDDAEEIDGGRLRLLNRGRRIADITERGLTHIGDLGGSCGLRSGMIVSGSEMSTWKGYWEKENKVSSKPVGFLRMVASNMPSLGRCEVCGFLTL
jgi:hypothetical protein